MIVAEQKALEEIREMIARYDKVLVVGCGTCVTVCFAGGEKEVGVLSSTLRMADKVEGAVRTVDEATILRQCEWEYIEPLKEKASSYDAILSLGCGVGVQTIAEAFPTVPVLPALNTTFMGLPVEPGVWAERCAGCWQLCPGHDRRHLPNRSLFQEPAERPVRRILQGQVRDRLQRGLRLADDLRPPEGARRVVAAGGGRRTQGLADRPRRRSEKDSSRGPAPDRRVGPATGAQDTQHP